MFTGTVLVMRWSFCHSRVRLLTATLRLASNYHIDYPNIYMINWFKNMMFSSKSIRKRHKPTIDMSHRNRPYHWWNRPQQSIYGWNLQGVIHAGSITTGHAFHAFCRRTAYKFSLCGGLEGPISAVGILSPSFGPQPLCSLCHVSLLYPRLLRIWCHAAAAWASCLWIQYKS